MKINSFILALLFVASQTKATVHTISLSSSAITPSTVNASSVGDTIKWVTACNCPHTTTSTTIPVCATAWNHTFPAVTGSTYSIVVTCPGTYNYENTTYAYYGVINVTSVSGIASIDNSNLSLAYPNPFSTKLTVETPNASSIVLYNIMGEKIMAVAIPPGQTKTELNTADINDGIYFYSLIRDGGIIETRKIIKN